MNWIKYTSIILIISVTLFMLLDYVFSYFNRKNSVTYSATVRPVYHHDFKKNIKKIKHWGDNHYELCTNSLGFKSSCANVDEFNNTDPNFDIVFIGDSFTQAIGVSYEKSFVGLFANHYPQLRVANMGVSSYSPVIYRRKIAYYLNKGMTFNHVFVFIDISDIHDEAAKYKRVGDVVMDREKITIYSIKLWLINNFLLSTKVYTFVRISLSSDTDTERAERALSRRGEWTYKPDSSFYGQGVAFGIDSAIGEMKKLYALLYEKNIKLSVGVYPWPNQLKHDVVDNRQVKIWQDFCHKRCEFFIDANPAFFSYMEQHNYDKTYRRFYIDGDSHFNENGNKVIFETIQNTISNQQKTLH